MWFFPAEGWKGSFYHLTLRKGFLPSKEILSTFLTANVREKEEDRSTSTFYELLDLVRFSLFFDVFTPYKFDRCLNTLH